MCLEGIEQQFPALQRIYIRNGEIRSIPPASHRFSMSAVKSGQMLASNILHLQLVKENLLCRRTREDLASGGSGEGLWELSQKDDLTGPPLLSSHRPDLSTSKT